MDNVEFVAPRSDNGNGGGYGQPTPPPQNNNGTIPGIMQPPQNQQQRMDLNGQNNGFTEVEDDELPF